MINGRLTRNHLQPDKPKRSKVLLQRCGTVILGDCDTAMFERVRRDECLCLVRSAQATARLLAVIAPGYGVQRAQRDILAGRCSEVVQPHPHSGRSLDNPDHPARWACFVLYGDAGYQTNANRILCRFRQWRASRALDTGLGARLT